MVTITTVVALTLTQAASGEGGRVPTRLEKEPPSSQIGTPRASAQEGSQIPRSPQLSPLFVKGLSLVSLGTCPSTRNKPH